MISENDILLLVSLGDTDYGYLVRGELAEMYGVFAEDLDDLILSRIYGDETE